MILKLMDFFSKNDAGSVPKNKLFKNHDTVLMKKLWIFFPEMTLAQFPKSDFFIFRWIFFPKMTLAEFPIFGFFFQDSRIGVKGFAPARCISLSSGA